MVDPEFIPFLPPLPPRYPPPAGSSQPESRAPPRAGGLSPDEVLQALLTGIPPQDRAGHGGRGWSGGQGPACRPLPRHRRQLPARSRVPPFSAFRKFCSWFPFVSASPPSRLHTPGLSPPPLPPPPPPPPPRGGVTGESPGAQPAAGPAAQSPALPTEGGFSLAPLCFNSLLSLLHLLQPPPPSLTQSPPPPFFFFFPSTFTAAFPITQSNLGAEIQVSNLLLGGL